MAEREPLEQRKAYHYECIRVINTQLNELVPVSRIPPELLSKIFLHTARHCAYPARGPPTVRDPIRVTHVCRHWRKIALQCATLWNRVSSPAIPARLAEFLMRSKEAPLSMTLSFYSLGQPSTRWSVSPEEVSPEDAVLMALSALYRVRTLTVNASGGHPGNVVLQHLSRRAPLLESLTITCHSSRTELAGFRASISRMLSHNESRRLRTLATDFSCITWGNIPWDGLTRLEVRGNPNPGESSPPSFFKALTCMPCLEELEMENFFVRRARMESPMESIPTLLDPINLPRLRRLSIHGQRKFTTATVLNNLHTPSLLYLSLNVVGGKDKDAYLAVAMAQKAATLEQFKTVAFTFGDLPETSIRAYCNICRRTKDPKRDSTSKWLEHHVPIFEYCARDRVENVSLAEFCTFLPLGDAQTLLLGYNLPLQGRWSDLAGCMEAVTELRLYVTGRSMPTLSPSPGKLLDLKQGDTGDGLTFFVLPNLRAFTIDGIDFMEVSPADRLEGGHRRKPGLVAELRACLARRAQEGAEIDTLRILDARGLWEEDLERLREVVPCVESDGVLENTRHKRCLGALALAS